MARFKIINKISGPEWLVKHKLAKQAKYNRKLARVQSKVIEPNSWPIIEDVIQPTNEN